MAKKAKKTRGGNAAGSKAVGEYLESLEQNRPKRGRKRTKASVEKALAEAQAKLDAATPGRRPAWAEKVVQLRGELAALESTGDHAAREAAFVKLAAGYSKDKGISYAAWRELGVPPDVLKKAGITRGS
ncbi:MAG: hypothetical protein R3A49_11540 [Acidimicrobiia bacterium]